MKGEDCKISLIVIKKRAARRKVMAKRKAAPKDG